MNTNFKQVQQHTRVMEAETIQKNGASLIIKIEKEGGLK
jgi:hypothetical protein